MYLACIEQSTAKKLSYCLVYGGTRHFCPLTEIESEYSGCLIAYPLIHFPRVTFVLLLFASLHFPFLNLIFCLPVSTPFMLLRSSKEQSYICGQLDLRWLRPVLYRKTYRQYKCHIQPPTEARRTTTARLTDEVRCGGRRALPARWSTAAKRRESSATSRRPSAALRELRGAIGRSSSNAILTVFHRP